MEMERRNPAPPPYPHDDVAFAEVATESYKSGSEFYEPLGAFREYWVQAEQIRFPKDQLKALTSQGIFVLKIYAKHKQAGGDVSGALSAFQKTFERISDEIGSHNNLETVIQNQDLVKKLELAIAGASEDLVAQIQGVVNINEAESITQHEGLRQARDRDHYRLNSLPASVKRSPSKQSLVTTVSRSMEESLKTIHYLATKRERIDAKRALAILADLTGQPLPPSTILDKEFVTVGDRAVHQGPSYDIFKGEYFTGEEIAIKVLRRRVDAETAKRTHERFARQAVNWSVLRHDTILPFYGAGVLHSPVGHDNFQLYVVSPYLKNQDVGRYLKKYRDTPAIFRLQMLLDIARGLECMHSGSGLTEEQGLVHGAINISNTLVKDNLHVAISGFSHTKLIIEGRPEAHTGDNDNFRYMGPEMLDEGILTYQSDIWSWAMTALEILTDEPPFGRKTKGPKVVQMIGGNKRPMRKDHPKLESYKCAEEIWQLFEDCWRTEPQDRPFAKEVIQRLNLITARSKLELKPDRLSDPPISGKMGVEEVISLLVGHGCPDITNQIQYEQCSDQPVAFGGFGNVYIGYLGGDLKVAIKCARVGLPSDDGTRSSLKSTAWEIYNSSKHHHRNILNTYGLALFRGQIALVTPWMEKGTVMEYIDRHPDADRCKIVGPHCGMNIVLTLGQSTGVATGLAYLHHNGSTHGDLKGVSYLELAHLMLVESDAQSNILMAIDGVPKITDFGTSVLKQYTLGFTGEGLAGQLSLRWAAPELLLEERTTLQTDVYALGMTILEIITNKPPYEYLKDRTVVGNILMGNIPRRPTEHIPEESHGGDELWKLLQKCWAKLPAERVSALEVASTMASITPSALRSTFTAPSRNSV